jgi:hypothetical protein
MATAWQLHATAWQLHGNCMATARRLLGNCTTQHGIFKFIILKIIYFSYLLCLLGLQLIWHKNETLKHSLVFSVFCVHVYEILRSAVFMIAQQTWFI